MADSSQIESEIKSLGDTGLRGGSSGPSTNKDKHEVNEASNNLQLLVGQSEDVIFCATTVFHFSLDRYELIIDRAKITVIKRLFLLADNITSIGLSDVLSVRLNAGQVLAH